MTTADPRLADDWQATGDPLALLERLRVGHRIATRKGGRRKFRLLGCSAARLVWDALPDDRLRAAVEAAERHAASEAGLWELRSAGEAAAESAIPTGPIDALANLFHPLLTVFGLGRPNRVRQQAGLELVRNLAMMGFGVARARTVLLAAAQVMTADGRPTGDAYAALAGRVREQYGNPYRLPAVRPEWRTRAALGLAAAAADGAFDRLPILADALEEVGCDDGFLLAHLRADPAVHARGCWAADAVLGHFALG